MRIKIQFFRSILDQDIELCPITLLYGENGAGKSSLIYALMTLKNIVTNPTQRLDNFFRYGATNLGGFDNVISGVSRTDELSTNIPHINLRFTHERENRIVECFVKLSKEDNLLGVCINEKENPNDYHISVNVTFPYSVNVTAIMDLLPNQHRIIWNGIVAQVYPKDSSHSESAQVLAKDLNAPMETLRRTTLVPLMRGFTKPIFSTISLTSQLDTEDEIATFLATNPDVADKLSYYLEQIFGKKFQVTFTPGTSIFSLDIIDSSFKVKTALNKEGYSLKTALINDGFGINQIVFFLAKALHPNAEWICIEEPEVHLHPRAIRQLAKVMMKLTKNEKKKFIISTHSQGVLSSFLARVSAGDLDMENLACYWAKKENGKTIFERQNVNDKGQVEGGFANFVEPELEDIKTFLGV